MEKFLQLMTINSKIQRMNDKITLKTLLKNNDTEAELYVIGLFVALLCAFLSVILLLLKAYTPIDLLSFCFFKQVFHIYCPGCGGTHALFYLLTGHPLLSLYCNAFVTYAVIFGAVFYISQTLRYITHGKVKGIKFRKLYIVIGIILLTVNFLVKNIVLLVFHIAMIP